MKVSIIGQGYVGLTVGLYASKEHEIVGYDLNEKLVSDLNSGNSHVEGLDSNMLKIALKNEKYKATSNPQDIDNSDVVIIAVPTPLDEKRKPDLSFIMKACETISDNLRNDALIINESTSYPGTVRNLIYPSISKKVPFLNHEYSVSPERVDPGRLDWNQENTPRLYAGLTKKASDRTREFYSSFCNNLVEVSSPEVAEAAKLFENTFRQVNIALVNEFAQIAHVLDIPVREVLDAAGTKPYGFMKFSPSAGVGGHCIPVDPSYLAEVAFDHGVKANFIELANQVNLDIAKYIVNRVKDDNDGNLSGKKVQLIGVAYKPNVADVRETPAEQIQQALIQEGAITSWHDPVVRKWKGSESSPLGAEIAIVITKHDIINAKEIIELSDYVFDTTGLVPGAIQL